MKVLNQEIHYLLCTPFLESQSCFWCLVYSHIAVLVASCWGQIITVWASTLDTSAIVCHTCMSSISNRLLLINSVTPEHQDPISLTHSLSPEPNLRRKPTWVDQTKFLIRNIRVTPLITVYINIHNRTHILYFVIVHCLADVQGRKQSPNNIKQRVVWDCEFLYHTFQ